MSAAQEARLDAAEAAFAEGNALWQQGAREAAINAFRRAVTLRPDYTGGLNNLGNALTECGRPEEALAPYRAALRLQPRNPERHYNLGNALLRMRRGREAEICFRVATRLAPGYAVAHNNLGNALRAQARHEEALASYRHALELRPDFAGTLGNIGNALLSTGRPAEAAEAFGRQLAAQPGNVEGWNCLGGAMLALARTAEGEAHFRHALELDPGHVKARFGLALALLRQGRLQEGWEEYESRWEDPEFDPDIPRFTEPLWRGEPITPGTTVLLYAEQGLGDFLQFIRYAPLLRRRGTRVLLTAPPGTAPLLHDMADAIVQRGEEIPPFDLRCPLLSLPRAFGTTLATIPAEVPYLRADPARIAVWRERLGPRPAGVRLRAGLAWSGNPDHPNDAMRSMGLARLAPLLGLPGIEWHAVQKDIRAEDGPALEAYPALRRHGEALTDFGETAALMSQLDVVVSVDTSLAHLAGALARPVLVMLPLSADFRWLDGRTDSPWYPTARLFRQTEPGAWDPVIAAVAAALSGR